GGLTFSMVSAGKVAIDSVGGGLGSAHSCGLTTAGAAYCWGGNGYGQIGDGSFSDRPSPTAATGGLVFISVSAGYYHSCGLTAAGAAWCWGNNFFGQLGDSSTTNRPNPVGGAAIAE